MCHQDQRHIHGVIKQQVLLRLLAVGAWFGRLPGRLQGRAHAFHVPQNALNNLLKVGFALAQVLVFHVIKLARNDFILRGQRPFGVIKPLCNPVFHAADELLVLQQHQVHIQQCGKFVGRVFGQVLLNP